MTLVITDLFVINYAPEEHQPNADFPVRKISQTLEKWLQSKEYRATFVFW